MGNLTAIPRPAGIPNRENLPQRGMNFDEMGRTAINPQAVFGAYANQQLQGAGTKSKFGQGTKITSGPMAGQQMGAAKVKLRDDLANAPDDVKQAAIDRSTGADLMPGYQKPMPDTSNGQTAPRLNTYGMGGKPDYSKLDWLAANRTTGDALKQQERNVGQGRDRNLTPVAPVKIDANAVSPEEITQRTPVPPPSAGGSMIPSPTAPPAPAAAPTTPMPSGMTPPPVTAMSKTPVGMSPDVMDEANEPIGGTAIKKLTRKGPRSSLMA